MRTRQEYQRLMEQILKQDKPADKMTFDVDLTDEAAVRAAGFKQLRYNLLCWWTDEYGDNYDPDTMLDIRDAIIDCMSEDMLRDLAVLCFAQRGADYKAKLKHTIELIHEHGDAERECLLNVASLEKINEILKPYKERRDRPQHLTPWDFAAIACLIVVGTEAQHFAGIEDELDSVMGESERKHMDDIMEMVGEVRLMGDPHEANEIINAEGSGDTLWGPDLSPPSDTPDRYRLG